MASDCSFRLSGSTPGTKQLKKDIAPLNVSYGDALIVHQGIAISYGACSGQESSKRMHSASIARFYSKGDPSKVACEKNANGSNICVHEINASQPVILIANFALPASENFQTLFERIAY